MEKIYSLHDTFLQLVRLGIGTSKDAKISKSVDWVALKALADAQGLTAIVLDGLDSLNTNDSNGTNLMPLQQKLEWIGEVLQEESVNARQRKAASELATIFKQHQIRTYELKGNVVAECYPKPRHRRSVDFDCYLRSMGEPKDVWEEGNSIIEQKGFEVRRDFYKNSTFVLPDLSVENHRYLTPFRGNKRLKKLERVLQTMMLQDTGEDVIDGTWLYRPPVMVSALFLIEHAYSHFLHEGLTWRMVLDWMMFSKKHRDEIDWPSFEAYIDEFGFRKFYDSYYRLGQYLIGEFQASSFTFQDKMMLSDIWAPLDVHETVRGWRGKLALAGNTWRARWKYRYFTDLNWMTALWIQVKGFLFEKEPKLN